MTILRDDQNQSYAIHVDVEGTQLPLHPGSGWTRFVCISDTHSRKYRVPSGNVLLHGGDLSSSGHPSDLVPTIEWLKSLDHPVKIIVAGNNDRCLDQQWGGLGGELDPNIIKETRAYMRSQAPFGLHYLEHEPLHLTSPTGRVWKVYGSPGAFQYETEVEARGTSLPMPPPRPTITPPEAIYRRIPDDTEILITHTPPYGTLDKIKKGDIDAGFQALSSRLNDLKDCRLHVFGHVHEATGTHVDEVRGTELLRVSVNAAMKRSGSAVVVDLRN